MVFPRAFQRTPLLQYLFLPSLDLLTGRNAFMTQTLVEHLKERDAISKILVVVGAGHRKGLATVLEREYGFSTEPLDVTKTRTAKPRTQDEVRPD